jgi:hypothetical protein
LEEKGGKLPLVFNDEVVGEATVSEDGSGLIVDMEWFGKIPDVSDIHRTEDRIDLLPRPSWKLKANDKEVTPEDRDAYWANRYTFE